MGNHHYHHLALFARFPSPGTCKTRLIAKLGAEGASCFALAALTDIMYNLTALPAHRTLFYTPAEAKSRIISWLREESLLSMWDVQPQDTRALDLGARLAAGLKHTYTSVFSQEDQVQIPKTPSTGVPVVTFIGMDCFDLTVPLVQDSMAKVSLSTGGPRAHIALARDGGYVLLTLPLSAAELPGVFDGIPWSSNRTAEVQITRLEEAGLMCIVGEHVLDDVDEPEDLERLWEGRGGKLDVYPRTMGYLATVMED